ncbi:hypothetical protein EZV62_006123 [Acer yangbiense]|uniref:Uncharacterized protein n=1 Tax=Acer yangbiense TaxID=1000413 RepID=A0A5C7IQ24_9ROSI|nr:hypothetical protein EZV62_006123 [Acer yangbiense]
MENITTWFSDVGLLVGYLFNKVPNNPLLPSRTAVIDYDVYGVDDHNRARMRLLEEISKEEDDTTYFFTTRSVERVMNSCMLSFIMSVFAGNQLNLFIGSDENCNLIWSLAFALPAFLKREVSLLYDSPTQKQYSSAVPSNFLRRILPMKVVFYSIKILVSRDMENGRRVLQQLPAEEIVVGTHLLSLS